MTHQLMPIFTGRHMEQPVIAAIFSGNPLEPVEHHQTEKIGGEEHVAAAAQIEARQLVELWIGTQGRQIGNLLHLGQPEAVRIEGKGVELQQGGVGIQFHRSIPAWCKGAVYLKLPHDEKPEPFSGNSSGLE